MLEKDRVLHTSKYHCPNVLRPLMASIRTKSNLHVIISIQSVGQIHLFSILILKFFSHAFSIPVMVGSIFTQWIIIPSITGVFLFMASWVVAIWKAMIIKCITLLILCLMLVWAGFVYQLLFRKHYYVQFQVDSDKIYIIWYDFSQHSMHCACRWSYFLRNTKSMCTTNLR